MNNEMQEIVRWRERIDEIDRQLVTLLNERAKCAEEIGKLKMKLGMEVYSPQREKEVMKNVTSFNTGPLSNDAIQRLFERIIDESRSLERVMTEKSKRREKKL